MSRTLLITARLHEPRFHGRPEWPPSPARLFQALVAGAGDGAATGDTARALLWLEAISPPSIAAPRFVRGQEVTYFVPNNDLDAKGGDPANVALLRVGKVVSPLLLDHGEIAYAWDVGDDATEHLDALKALAAGLYQLGRGVDMASATADLLARQAADDRLSAFDGELHHPGAGGDGAVLSCPRAGTLDSLIRRQRDFSQRFGHEGEGKSRVQVFRQPRKPFLREVGYSAGVRRDVFEIRARDDAGRFAPVPPSGIHDAAVRWRDAAVVRLVAAGVDEAVARGVLVGRRPGEPEVVRPEHRARLILMPSIGHQHVDASVRRLVLEIPDGGPLRADDVRWAFSGLTAGEAVLVPAGADGIVDRYLSAARVWSTVTPVAIPGHKGPAATVGGRPDRATTEAEVRSSVLDALRHAGVRARPSEVEVQREPWSKSGSRTEVFASGERFSPGRLWHVRLSFERRVSGPLLIGDGRYLGLGLFAPEAVAPRRHAFAIVEGLQPDADAIELAGHLRRAVMARAQRQWGRERLPEWLTGHRFDGSPAHRIPHARYLADPDRGVVWVELPAFGCRRDDLARLDAAMDGFAELRAGDAGLLLLRTVTLGDEHPCLRPSATWESVTPYAVDRHARAGDAAAAVEIDVRRACHRADLPEPIEVVVRSVRARSGAGLTAHLTLRFATAVSGPIALGRGRHKGGGLMRAVGAESDG